LSRDELEEIGRGAALIERVTRDPGGP
jgi:hypothetical protein